MRIIIKFILKVLEKIIYRVKIINSHNIPKEGGAIICANHIHALDAALIVCTAKRKMNVLAKEELFKNPIIRWLGKIFGAYPVKRDGNDISAIKISLSLLKNKELLLIFPEGTRNGIQKGIKLKSGAINIAIKSKVPIIPVGVQGSYKPFKQVRLIYGKPICYDQYEESIKTKDMADELTIKLMDEILKLAKTDRKFKTKQKNKTQKKEGQNNE